MLRVLVLTFLLVLPIVGQSNERTAKDIFESHNEQLKDIDKKSSENSSLPAEVASKLEDYLTSWRNGYDTCKSEYELANGLSIAEVQAATSSSEDGMYGKCKKAGVASQNIRKQVTAVTNRCGYLRNICDGATSAKPVDWPDGPDDLGSSHENLSQTIDELPENTADEITLKNDSRSAFNTARSKCYAKFDSKLDNLTGEWITNRLWQNDTLKVCKKIKTGLKVGGALVVGGLLYKDHKDKEDKKDKKKKQRQMAQMAEDGIFMVDGQQMDCNQASNGQEEACQPYWMEICSGDKKNYSNCIAFDTNYCADQNTKPEKRNYCLYAESKNYCRSSSYDAAATQSPACQWVNERDGEMCASEPGNVQCLAPMSTAALDVACPAYERDPLCAAHKTGMVVSQPNAGESSVAAESSEEGDSSVGTASNTSGGQLNVASLNGPSVWATSSSALQDTCQNGTLYDCGATGRTPASSGTGGSTQ